MELESDLRARCAFNRLVHGVRTDGGAVGRGGEYNARRRRPPVRSDGSDDRAVGLQVEPTSV